MIKHVRSLNELQGLLDAPERSWLLLYKKGSEQSECAYRNFEDGSAGIEGIRLLAVDVSAVRDIHPRYKITSAPALIEFEDKTPRNIIKGCHDPSFFRAIFEDAVYHTEMKKQGIQAKRVIVYSTPACSWCNTLKSYLRQNRIRFHEIDVSRDQQAAGEMVRRSGQSGVPQTDINGTMIVGFDKKRISELLEIKG